MTPVIATSVSSPPESGFDSVYSLTPGSESCCERCRRGLDRRWLFFRPPERRFEERLFEERRALPVGATRMTMLFPPARRPTTRTPQRFRLRRARRRRGAARFEERRLRVWPKFFRAWARRLARRRFLRFTP